MTMGKLLVGGVAVMGLAMFSACGSSSSSSASDSERTEKVPAVVDEESQTISLYVKDSEKFCVRSENNTYAWKDVQMYDDTLLWGYKFVGDTLVIIENLGSTYEWGMVLTGGTAGKLYGTWTLSNQCYYENNEIECDDSYLSRYVYQYKFSKNSITAKRTLANAQTEEDDEDSEEIFDDYMNSSFMKYFFYSLYMEDDFDQYVWSLRWDDSSAVQSYSTIYPVSSKSKTSMTFTVEDKNVTVKVNDFKYDSDADEFSAKVSVSTGSKTCSLEYVSVDDITSSYCKAENAEYFDIEEEEDAYGNEFYYVDEYVKDNTDEFNECLNEMFFGESTAKVLNKKVATTSVNAQKLRKLQRQFYKAVKNNQN